MSQKYSKQDLKSPDALTTELKKGFQWTTQHSKLLTLALAAFVLVGASFSAFQFFQNKKESEFQSQYYTAEKAYLAGKAATPPQDTTATSAQLESIIEKAPSTNAAAMSALLLSQIHSAEADRPKAEAALTKIKARKGLLSSLVTMELGNVRADLGKCDDAVAAWNEVVGNNEVQFLHAQAHINKGLCLQKAGKAESAKESFQAAKTADPQGEMGRNADKYLRLLEQARAVQ